MKLFGKSFKEMNSILVRFGEIGLKGKNRSFFERKLVNNIRTILKENEVSFDKILRISGRFIILTDDRKAIDALKYVFGIVSYSPAIMTEMDFDRIKELSLKILKEKKPENFRISSRRLDKNLNTTSQKINEIIGEYLVKNTNIPVNLDEPLLDIGIDLTLKNAFIFTEEFTSLGGLPVGVSGRVLCFISGGIDSPVATFLSMKRGCEAILVHFLHDESEKRPSKIVELYEVLKRYQPDLKLILIPTSEIEREILKNIPSKYRIIILRRMFLLIANRIMEKEDAKAIVTGDNIGQVASQTLYNISVIQQASNNLVLRPLLGYDKNEIINLAIKIGTYPISIKPYTDCCSFLLPKHPETKARLEEILECEKNIDMKLVDKAVERSIHVMEN